MLYTHKGKIKGVSNGSFFWNSNHMRHENGYDLLTSVWAFILFDTIIISVYVALMEGGWPHARSSSPGLRWLGTLCGVLAQDTLLSQCLMVSAQVY